MITQNSSLLKAKIRIKEAIIADIRELILTGQLVPDQIIYESELTKRFGTSRSPVREALIYLEQEGLVKIIPKKGTVVTKIDLDQLNRCLITQANSLYHELGLYCEK